MRHRSLSSLINAAYGRMVLAMDMSSTPDVTVPERRGPYYGERAKRRNRQFGRKPKGNTTPAERRALFRENA